MRQSKQSKQLIHFSPPALALALVCACTLPALAQADTGTDSIPILPEVTVTGDAADSGTLTVPDTAQATRNIQRTPGGVEVVPDSDFKDGPAQTIKDVLEGVPGVITQTRYGPDARISIRGSGLSRSYGNRGINMYMDGIPINTSDGLFDLFEIDPTAYRYVEVYKGANALRYGANSLGGAINFVTPSGHDAAPLDTRFDAGSFGYKRGQVSSGGVAGAFDYFVTGSSESWDGYREHSDGHQERVSANFGFRFSPDAETRFYVNTNSWRSRLPGEVTKASALNSPKTAAADWITQDQQRNIDSIRVADKTTLRFGPTTLEFGLFAVNRHVMHPIYQYLDYYVRDRGGFIRAIDDRSIGGFRNNLTVGVNVLNGTTDNNQYQNIGGEKGTLAASNIDAAKNVSVYAENAFYVEPDVALIAGTQYMHTTRQRIDRFLSDGDQSGSRSYDLWSPKVGILWDVDPSSQAFANISDSAEAPTFDVNTFGSPASSNVDAQTATTYEIGTRGHRPDVTWDVALYRANIDKELQCLTAPSMPGSCTVRNADHTVHQGIEAGFGLALLKSAFTKEDSVWLNAVYTYNDFFFDNDASYGNNRLPGVQTQLLHAELLYKRASGFYAGPNVEWSPNVFYADNANQVTVDPYALLNFRIGFNDRGAGWSGYLEARNLLDKRYISSTVVVETATAASALFNPGTGRAIYGGLRFAW